MWQPAFKNGLLLARLAPQPQHNRCDSKLINLPSIEGVQWLNTSAESRFNYTGMSMAPESTVPQNYTVDFCDVTVTYKHIGWNDSVNVHIWLPLEHDWNGRLWAIGGGGYSSSWGGGTFMLQAVARGYATLDTDSGRSYGQKFSTYTDWALSSPGNSNLELIANWGYRALDSLATIGKSVVGSFYEKAPSYSYFTGCSGGGRQALTIAQRRPNDFDGILASAPAIDFETVIPTHYWPRQVAKSVESYPQACEIKAFTQAALDACDGLGGVVDGMISHPQSCNFTAASVVGQQFACDGVNSTFSSDAAQIIQAAWDGATSSKHGISSPGVSLDADLTVTYIVPSNTTNPNDLLTGWFSNFFLHKGNASFSLDALTDDDFFDALYQSRRDFSGALGAHQPLLTKLRKSGTKLLSWHDLADETVPFKISSRYYDEVLDVNPKGVQDYYRFFAAPGVAHCVGGVGPIPDRAFHQLRAWMESGTAPEVLYATKGNDIRPLCPEVQTFVGNGEDGKQTFKCKA